MVSSSINLHVPLNHVMSDSDVVEAFKNSLVDESISSSKTSPLPFFFSSDTERPGSGDSVTCGTEDLLDFDLSDDERKTRRGSGTSNETMTIDEIDNTNIKLVMVRLITDTNAHTINTAYVHHHAGLLPEQRFADQMQRSAVAVQRSVFLARFRAKRTRRVWTKRVAYAVRSEFACIRPRVNGRFVKQGSQSRRRSKKVEEATKAPITESPEAADDSPSSPSHRGK